MIDPESPLPFYQQVARWLREQIDDGTWCVGEMIPSEDHLCRRFGISRGCVREAVDVLVREGLVQKRRGVGTFVTRPRAERNLAQYMSLFNDLEAQGRHPSCTVVDARFVAADADASASLQVPSGARAAFIRRVFSVAGRPFCVARTHLPADLFPDILDRDLATTALWDVMVRDYGQQVQRVVETYDVALLRSDEAELLKTRVGSAVLAVHLRLHSRERPIECTRMLLHPERCTVHYEHHFTTSQAARRIIHR